MAPNTSPDQGIVPHVIKRGGVTLVESGELEEEKEKARVPNSGSQVDQTESSRSSG